MTRQEAESLLTSTVLPMVRGMASRYARRSGLSFDDLIQEGLVAAWQKLPEFDESRCSLNGFLAPRVLGAFRDYARAKAHPLGWRARRHRIEEMPRGQSLEFCNRFGDEETFHLVDTRPANCPEEPADFERLLSPLGSREKAIVRMIFRSGMTHREIAGELHCCETTVHNTLVRSLAVLRERWRQAA